MTCNCLSLVASSVQSSKRYKLSNSASSPFFSCLHSRCSNWDYFRSCYTQNTSLKKIFIFERPTCPLPSMWWWKGKQRKAAWFMCCGRDWTRDMKRWEKQADVSGLSSHLRPRDVLSCADTKDMSESVLMSRANITTKSHVDVLGLGCQPTPC